MVKDLVPGDWVVLKKLSEWHEKDYGFYLRRHIGDKFLILGLDGEKVNTIVRRKAKRWMQRIADSRKKG